MLSIRAHDLFERKGNDLYCVVPISFPQAALGAEIEIAAIAGPVTLKVPAGAAHVDLTGKTVMPAMVDLHGHLGYQNIPAGTMSKETFTRENLIESVNPCPVVVIRTCDSKQTKIIYRLVVL